MAARGLVRARARAQAGVLVTAAALLLVTAAVVSAVVVHGEQQATGGLRSAVRQLPPAEAVADVRTTLGEDPAAQHRAVVEDVDRLVGGAGARLSRSTRSGLLDVLEPAGDGQRVVAMSYDDLPAHARLVSGAWPAATGEVGAALHAAAAATLGVAAGDALVVEGEDGPVTVRVTGIWQPADPGDPFFAGTPLETAGAQSATVAGPLVVEDLVEAGLADRPTARWRLTVDAAQVRPADLGVLAAGVQRLRSTVTGDPRVGADVQVGDSLGPALARLQQRVVVARSVAALPAVLVAVLAGAALLLVARLLADARDGETRLVRARGASARQVAGWTATEALLLAVPVALLAPPLGLLLARAVGTPAALGPTLWATGALVAVAGAVLLLAPSLAAARRWSAVAPAGRRRDARLRAGADLVLLAVAAVAVWQLHRYGAATTAGRSGAPAVDPLLVAAPALALLAGAVLAVRLLPVAAALAQRLLTRRPGLTGVLAAWQVGRRPAGHAVPLLLVTLSVAAGVLTAGYAATTRGLQDDVAAQRAGADVRVLASGGGAALPAAARAGTYAGVPGVEAVTTVSTTEADASSTPVTVLAVDAATAAATVRLPGGPGPEAAELLALVGPAGGDGWDGVALPEGTGAVEVDLRLAQQGFVAAPGAGVPSAGLTLWVGSPTGELVGVPLGSWPLPEPGPRHETVAVDLPAAAAWTVVGLDLEVASVSFREVTYSAEVTAVRAGGAAVDPGGTGWREVDTAVPAVLPPPDVQVGGTGWPATVLAIAASGPSGQVRTRVGTGGDPGPAPAVVTRDLAAANDLAPGAALTVVRQGVGTPLRVTGVADRLPGVAGAAVLVDLRALTAGDFARGATPPVADEWWLAVAEQGRDEVVAAVADVEGAPGEVVRLDQVARGLVADPLGAASAGAVDLGLLAAIGLTAAGLAVGAAVTARQRRVEVAVLRAVGVTAAQVRRVQAAEQLAVAAVAVPAGLLAGAAVARLTLPQLVVAGDAGPALQPVVRFSLLAAALVVAGVLAAVALVVAGHWLAAGRRPLAADVRLGADR